MKGHRKGSEAEAETEAEAESESESETETEPETAKVAGPRVSGTMRALSLGLLIVIGACIGGGVVRTLGELLQPGAPPPPAEVIEIRPTPDVITAMHDLARLEGASFHIERVVELGSQQRRLFGLVEAADTILLVAAADVVAGVDLAELRDGDVVIEPDARRAVITLPRAVIFSARLDGARTYVYRRDTDALAQRREDLETRARREAERTLENAALEGGILERAEVSVTRTVEALVRSLGYDHVEVRFRGEGDALAPDPDPPYAPPR